jgi:hypothetical protein
MRGWVCRLQFLRALASAVILSQIGEFSKLDGQVPVYITPGTGWPSYTPRHWVPFSSPHTTRRAMVEVIDHVSTRDTD